MTAVLGRWTAPLTAAWIVLLAFAIAYPFATDSSTADEDVTRFTVRISLLFWLLAVVLLMCTREPDRSIERTCYRIARWFWTLAWLAYLVHLAMAFGLYHQGSHVAAVAHTEAVSGFGEGIWFSHLFTLLWTLDVAVWWVFPAWHAGRSAWLGRGLHGYMLFIIFNSTVVWETGFIRWAGVTAFAFLVGLYLWRRLHKGRRGCFHDAQFPSGKNG
jgi:hypothetical protein